MSNKDQSNNSVYNAYTPFRNFLRKMDLFRSLQAIWAHVVFQQYGRKLPKYIYNLPIGYNNSKTSTDFLNYHLHLWELETLAKEVILNSAILGKNKNLENWNYLSKAINQLKNLENEIAAEFSSRDNVLLELHRISHRQFPWQSKPNQDKLIRYWKIYSPLQEYFQKVFKIDFDIFLTIGMMLFGFYLDKFALNYPPDIQVNKIKQDAFEKFLKYTCKSICEQTTDLKKQLAMNHDYAYAYHNIKGFPLTKIDYNNKTFITCPLPTLLLNRFTDGLFYDLIDQHGFDNAFGESFQNYIGEYLKLGTPKGFTVSSENTYGSRRHKKQSVDWIVVDKENNALFIECKTKRMTVGGKTALNDLGSLKRDLTKLAEAIVQTYETIIDYEQNLYPQLKYESSRKIYVLVATLEEWYLFGNKTSSLLNQEVESIFNKHNLDKKYLKKYPYFIISTENIELLTDLLNKRTIEEIFSPKVSDQDKHDWHIRTYLLEQFNADFNNIKNPFATNYSNFLDATILKMKN